MRILLLGCLLGLAATSAAIACEYDHADDRQDVKNSMLTDQLNAPAADVDAGQIIRANNAAVTHYEKHLMATTPGRWPGQFAFNGADGVQRTYSEGQRISVVGYLYRAQCDPDGDLHMEIGATPDPSGPCMLVEAPSPSRINDPVLLARVQSVLNQEEAIGGVHVDRSPPKHVRFSGALFIDAHHMPAKTTGNQGGRRGTRYCATNVWEVHPATDMAIGVD